MPAGRQSGGRPSDDDWQELYSSAPCGLYSATSDGLIVTINDTLLGLTGRSRESLLGLSFVDLLARGSRLFYETRCLPVLQLTGKLREVALTIVRPDGTELSVLINSTAVETPGGPLVRTAVFDSTGRQDYERELLAARRAAERSESRVRALQEASIAFGSSGTERLLAESLCRIARTTFTATEAVVHLVDAAGVLRVTAGIDPLAGAVTPDTARPETAAMRAGRVITLASVDETRRSYPEVADALRAARRAALCAIPLVAEGGVAVGVLVCFFGRGRLVAEDDIELQEALARQAMQSLGRIRLQSELARLAMHDPLTGLASRKLLHDHLEYAIPDAERANRSLSLLFLDLDGFRRVNDGLGHHVGDGVLRQISGRLAGAVRDNDIIGRFGEDEFVIICENAGLDASALVAERVRDATSRALDDVPTRFRLSSSIGVAVFDPKSGASPSAVEFIARADAALHESKAGGKDRVTVVAV